MAESSEQLLTKLATLNDSLDDLEDRLEPLLSQTLPESLLPLETIQQVKLNVALPYLVYDLIFIYLKTRGIDPKTHPVVGELDRVRQYFDKIKNAEDPEKRKTTVDKAAANRFIKHAIAQVKDQRPPGEAQPGPSHIRFDAQGNAPSGAPTPSSSAPATSIPVRVTAKMRARAEWQRKLADEDENDEGDADALQVFDDDEAGEDEEDLEEVSTTAKAKGKGKTIEEQTTAAAVGKKRRRAAMDPFAGTHGMSHRVLRTHAISTIRLWRQCRAQDGKINQEEEIDAT
ncbi:Sas10/Utp3/C1D family-domain-containing protein [Earliella scabrosa]|nr:Sas10/Utp3/C1D family-domain-containing protein [Earliella scabrosa]